MSQETLSAEEKYKQKFKGKSVKENKKWEKAYRMAIDTRKFEIEMYWKRATYFWAFIAVTFAGFGATYKNEGTDSDLPFILACFGFVLSFAWFLANRGSKQWQENWERHVDHLEDKVTGPLYKTVLKRGREKRKTKKIINLFVGPSSYSVSKINQLISLYMTIIWLGLILLAKSNWKFWEWNWDWQTVFMIVITVVAILSITWLARTYDKSHQHIMDERESKIITQETKVSLLKKIRKQFSN